MTLLLELAALLALVFGWMWLREVRSTKALVDYIQSGQDGWPPMPKPLPPPPKRAA